LHRCVRSPPHGFWGVHLTCSTAYVLNLRGDDVPYNPVFVSYLYIGLDRAILFIEQDKVELPVREYLQNLKIEIRDYNGIWSFLRTREWGEGKVCGLLPSQILL
jgi:Xaa-Pro aminopeptidase